MRNSLRLIASTFGCLAIALMLAAGGSTASAGEDDISNLRDKGFTQWSKWITSRDAERRVDAARLLGSYHDRPEAVGLLAAALSDREDSVRIEAAGSLWELADDDADISAANAALHAALNDPHPRVQLKAAGALEKSGVDGALLVEARQQVLQRGNWFDIALAVRDLIGWVDAASLVEPLLTSLRQTPTGLKRDQFSAANVFAPLVRRGGETVPPLLMQALADPGLRKASIISALAQLDVPAPGWRERLIALRLDTDASTREQAATAMSKLVGTAAAGDDWAASMRVLLDDPNRDVRLAACALFRAGGGAGHVAVDALIALLADETDAYVRGEALRALAAIGDPAEAFDRAIKSDVAARARPIIQQIAQNDDDPDTRETAQQALLTLSEGSATGTRVLAPTAAADGDALSRLRAAGTAFTEDSFWRALNSRDVQTVSDLLDAGIQPAQISANGMPPLHMLAMTGCDYGRATAESTRQLVSLLLRHGADPNQRDTNGGNTALHRATSCDASVVKQLIAAKVDMSAKNATGMTAFPVFLAINPQVGEVLLDAGHRPDAAEKSMLQAMLSAESDAAKRKVLQRAIGLRQR